MEYLSGWKNEQGWCTFFIISVFIIFIIVQV